MAEGPGLGNREQRLVFGEDAALYDRARPGYPAELIDRVSLLADDSGMALDVGCGTGKAAVAFASRGWRGIGVEPDAAMAAVARQHLGRFGTAWSVEIEAFETFLVPLHAFDLVTCAQAWHWFDAPTALGQVQQALRPGGWLALFWNRPAPGGNPLRAELDEAYARHAPNLASREPGSKGTPPTAEELAGGFGAAGLETFFWSATSTAAQYVELLCTQSDHRLLPASSRNLLLAAITAVIDGAGGTIRVQHQSDLYTCQKQ